MIIHAVKIFLPMTQNKNVRLKMYVYLSNEVTRMLFVCDVMDQ